MKIWSMFDGISCGRIAAERAGLNVEEYQASEIDKYAIKVSEKNYPDIVRLGDALSYKDWDVHNFDLALAGSPCQDLSRAKTGGKGLMGDKSSLFYAYYNALEKFNPKYFLLENVVMNKEDENIITKLLGVEPVLIDSGNFSAQNRERLYWTNIDFDKQFPKSDSVIKDILEDDVKEKYFYRDRVFNLKDTNKRVVGNLDTHTKEGKRHFTDLTSRVYNINHKCATLTAVNGGHQEKKVYVNDSVRKLTPLEYERLQTVPDNYTSCVSNSQRYKTLGNGWTVDVIAHILGGIK